MKSSFEPNRLHYEDKDLYACENASKEKTAVRDSMYTLVIIHRLNLLHDLGKEN